MITAHERIRAASLLPTAPYDLLLDTEAEYVIVTWPGIHAGLSLVISHSPGQEYCISNLCPHQDWVRQQLGWDRWDEIEAAADALLATHHETVGRVREIFEVLERNSNAH